MAGRAMKNRDSARNDTPCNDENGERYLGNRDQIEELLGFGNITQARKRTSVQISLQPQEQINSVLEETK
jgi:hypothetical protein